MCAEAGAGGVISGAASQGRVNGPNTGARLPQRRRLNIGRCARAKAARTHGSVPSDTHSRSGRLRRVGAARQRDLADLAERDALLTRLVKDGELAKLHVKAQGRAGLDLPAVVHQG